MFSHFYHDCKCNGKFLRLAHFCTLQSLLQKLKLLEFYRVAAFILKKQIRLSFVIVIVTKISIIIDIHILSNNNIFFF